jgi:hypothetical protein
MKYIFVVIIGLLLCNTSFAAAAPATAHVDERMEIAQHIQRLAANNALWLEGFYGYFDSQAVTRDATKAEELRDYKDTVKREEGLWNYIAGNAKNWETNTVETIYLLNILNAALTRISQCDYEIDVLGCKGGLNDFDQQCLQNSLLQKRDFEDIIGRTLLFTSEAYQVDLSFSKPVYNKAKAGETSLFTFNVNDTVDINDISGGSMTFSLTHPPTIKIHSASTDTIPWIEVNFPSGLGFIRDGRRHAIVGEQLNLLKNKIAEYQKRQASLREVEGWAADEVAAAKKKPGKKNPRSGAAIGSVAPPLAALEAMAITDSSAGRGSSSSGAGIPVEARHGRMDPDLKAKILYRAAQPLYSTPLSAYASYAGDSQSAPSMDRNDQAMLANLLKVNGDRNFGDIHTANHYNWTKLKLLLEHLGFIETKNNYEFTYNGNSIKLHYVHWSQHHLDDHSVGIMFQQMANIGLTEAVLKGILGIAPAGAGCAV